jgi:hypothetical protein
MAVKILVNSCAALMSAESAYPAILTVWKLYLFPNLVYQPELTLNTTFIFSSSLAILVHWMSLSFGQEHAEQHVLLVLILDTCTHHSLHYQTLCVPRICGTHWSSRLGTFLNFCSSVMNWPDGTLTKAKQPTNIRYAFSFVSASYYVQFHTNSDWFPFAASWAEWHIEIRVGIFQS